MPIGIVHWNNNSIIFVAFLQINKSLDHVGFVDGWNPRGLLDNSDCWHGEVILDCSAALHFNIYKLLSDSSSLQSYLRLLAQFPWV